MKIVSRVLLLLLLMSARPLWAENSTVFVLTVNKPVKQIYPKVYDALEDARFFVVKELDIGNNLSGFAEKWGDEYNQSGLSAIRSMVFCNGWYANQVSNKDPRMLGLCPLHMTLIEKDGKTTALFNRPTAIAVNSPAYNILSTIENDVIEAIKKGMQ
jgi:uncharacterized protein (DUF302 family)